MEKAIIGKKVGMTQIFDEAGKVIPVTVIEAGPCTVIQKKTVDNDGYNAVQLGFEDIREKQGREIPAVGESDGWTEHMAVIEVPEGQDGFGVKLGGSLRGGQKAWFDNLTVHALPPFVE